MVLPLETWIGIAVGIIAFWGVATWALVRSMRMEEHKLELIESTGSIETYSPTGLAELREWILANPDDPYVEEAKRVHNDCVRRVREIEETFYEWDPADIERLETIE